MGRERVNGWEFYQYRDGRWTWRNVGANATRESQQAFESWAEAMVDAINEGFEAGESSIAFDGRSRRAHPRFSEHSGASANIPAPAGRR